MKHQDIINELRNELVEFVTKAEASSAMQLYDAHVLAEDVVLGLFKELWGLPNLRNLNTEERKNFPGIDLADDISRVAIQVTATPTLEKVKGTVTKFLEHGLDSSYEQLLVYVLTRKQASYSTKMLDDLLQGKLDFDPERHVLDFRDILARATHAPPSKVKNALEVLLTYKRGASTVGLSDIDFDPPKGSETVQLNLVEVFFPSIVYLAELLPSVATEKTNRRATNKRNMVRETLKEMGLDAPTEFEVHGNQVITFDSLDDRINPLASIIDIGTLTPIGTVEFADIDGDHERILKSLLRRCLQKKLYNHSVQWMHEEGLFVFVPRKRGDLLREESWFGKKKSTRRVFERKLSKLDADKTFICKHFAFAAEFVRADGRWFVALTPDWFFSFGDEYRRSRFADTNISWLKRKESNRIVADHFRFLVSWLGKLDAEDLFASPRTNGTQLSFGEAFQFENHPTLDDDEWLPIKDDLADDPELFKAASLFDKQ